ncbi:MAG: hypothetical protein WDZ93_01695 [Candidatus Paceibacterota bacterium]
MTNKELMAAVCDDAIRIFDLRLEGKDFNEIYKADEFERIRRKTREHSLALTDNEIFELIVKEYSGRLRTT